MCNKIAIDVNSFQSAIIDALEEYSQETTEHIKDAVKETAKETKNMLKKTSPKKTGEYKKDWSTKKSFESNRDIRISVYNKKHYQLTHLLEYGHAIRNGTGRTYGKVKAYPHIKQAEEFAKKELIIRSEKAVK